MYVSNMKNINIVFEDSEYDQLSKKKGDKSWHDFILELRNGKR
jgi:predicted CopG family antitoxin